MSLSYCIEGRRIVVRRGESSRKTLFSTSLHQTDLETRLYHFYRFRLASSIVSTKVVCICGQLLFARVWLKR